jgi:putative addiction module component (TIGR02574 family)
VAYFTIRKSTVKRTKLQENPRENLLQSKPTILPKVKKILPGIIRAKELPMSPLTDVLDVALQLSKAERARVAEALLESLDDDRELPDEDHALDSEIDRRLEAFRDGKTTAEDWRIVMQRVKAELASRHP